MCSSNCDERLFPTRHFPRNLCRILSKPATTTCETNKNRWTWHGICFLATFRSRVPGPYLWMILLMADILHHLGCINPTNNGINHQPQLVQDFSHQQYIFTFFCGCLFEDGLFFSAGTWWIWKTCFFYAKICTIRSLSVCTILYLLGQNLWLEFVEGITANHQEFRSVPKMEGFLNLMFGYFGGGETSLT